ncbi:hypothetical protein [Sphingomonas quercus]|nr:hypothetical protein [Sphingomonas quercus]
MQKSLLAIAATATLALGMLPSTASAAPWQNMNARKNQIERQIDQGVRTGRLTRQEASGLRGQFASLMRLERDYSRGGLSIRERSDLDRRYDALSARVRAESRDRQVARRR